jgi:hypothetical protein
MAEILGPAWVSSRHAICVIVDGRLLGVWDQPAADDQLARAADHAEDAVAHAELQVVGVRASIDLELIVDSSQPGIELEPHAGSGCVQTACDGQPIAAQRRAFGHEADFWVILDVEEVA